MPLWTTISLLATLLVEVLLMIVPSVHWGFAGAIGKLGVLLLLLVGSVMNIILGRLATSGGERWGGRIALTGIGLWFVTIALWLATHPQQW